jgi:hypothetical protein
MPSALSVLAKAMGRGATAPRMNWCKSFVAISAGSILSMNFIFENILKTRAKVTPCRRSASDICSSFQL